MTPKETPLAWCDNRTIDVGKGQHVGALWHCFGVKTEIVDEKTALAMLRASQTTLLPINCHRLNEPRPVYGAGVFGEPLIGHGDITWREFKPLADGMGLIPCLNINLQTSGAAAVELARQAHSTTGIDLLKLEVLSEDHTRSKDWECVEATKVLEAEGFRVMPLISDNVAAARALADTDVPLIRVMGSPIGSGKGIEHPETIRQIIGFGKPIILDGGIGYNSHVLEAMRLGCAGLLVNSMLFQGDDPVGTLRSVRLALRAWTPEFQQAGPFYLPQHPEAA